MADDDYALLRRPERNGRVCFFFCCFTIILLYDDGYMYIRYGMMMSYGFVVACSIVFTIISMNLLCYFNIAARLRLQSQAVLIVCIYRRRVLRDVFHIEVSGAFGTLLFLPIQSPSDSTCSDSTLSLCSLHSKVADRPVAHMCSAQIPEEATASKHVLTLQKFAPRL